MAGVGAAGSGRPARGGEPGTAPVPGRVLPAHPPIRARALSALAAVVLLAACSGADGSTPPTAAPTVTAGAGPTADAAPEPGPSASAVPAPGGTAASATATPGASGIGVPSPGGASERPEPFTVRAALFGTHVGRLGEGGGPVPPRAGAVRLWDASVAWRQLEPVPGRVNWSLLDRAVSRAESMGARDILWVHGSPPQWAARNPRAPGLYGPGTSSPPEPDAYLSMLRRVAERYRGRITSYQIWNEANISIFYRGKADDLAALTARADRVLAEADPEARLVGASTTVRSRGPVKAWYAKYTAGLAQRDWPVDVMAVHLYPRADEGVEERAGYIRTMRQWLAERGWSGPVWDTEVNFGDRRDFAVEQVTVGQEQATAWVARTYIDSLALGIDRAYWYGWNDHILGIDQVDPGSGRILPAGQAYLTVQDWLRGARWRGCTGELMEPTGERGRVTTCSLRTREGRDAQLLFTHAGTARVDLPSGAAEVCRLDGSCEPTDRPRLKVGTTPVMVVEG